LTNLEKAEPDEHAGVIEQCYWNDWVERNDREMAELLGNVLPQVKRHLLETQKTLNALAQEVSHLARSVTSKQQKREAYNVKEVAEMVGKSEWTVRRWIKGGKLPATRCKKRDPFMVSSEDIQEFMLEYGSGTKALDVG